MNSHFPWTALALSTLLLSACALGPDYQRPHFAMPDVAQRGEKVVSGGQNSGGQNAQNAAFQVASAWWEDFNDPVLNQLIAQALDKNLSLQAGLARVDEARAGLTLSRANLLPQWHASANSTRLRNSKLGIQGLAQGGEDRPDTILEQHQAGLTLSYQLDLFGKNRRALEGARARRDAAAFQYENLRITIAAQVARAYFALRALDAQLEIAKQTLASREQALRLREKRFRGGLSSELEYRQAEAETATARMAVPRLTQSRLAAESALHILIGSDVKTLVESSVARGLGIENMHIPPAVPAHLPSDLLARRPDLRAAEAALIAANASIGEAKAAFFPSLNLTGVLGSESVELARLLSAPATMWTAAASVAWPILTAGKNLAGYRAATARQKQALADYRLAVHTAFAEAHDYLSAQYQLNLQAQAQKTQLTALRRALHLAKLRHDNGYSNYLDVLDAQRNLFAAELDFVQMRQAQLDAVVNVYLALGGGFVDLEP